MEGSTSEIKIGDKVEYTPVTLKSDKKTVGTISDFEPAGEIFNQPMLVIKELSHWILANECEKLGE